MAQKSLLPPLSPDPLLSDSFQLSDCHVSSLPHLTTLSYHRERCSSTIPTGLICRCGPVSPSASLFAYTGGQLCHALLWSAPFTAPFHRLDGHQFAGTFKQNAQDAHEPRLSIRKRPPLHP